MTKLDYEPKPPRRPDPMLGLRVVSAILIAILLVFLTAGAFVFVHAWISN